MSVEQPRRIQPVEHLDAAVTLPPSKSYTNRALITSALGRGPSFIQSPSEGDDTRHLINALRAFGIRIQPLSYGVVVEGCDGDVCTPEKEIFTGNAGTAIRFLTTFASLAKGTTVLTGDDQMLKRPIGDLTKALRSAGVECSDRNGYPPIRVSGGGFRGGTISLKATASSQFVSSILLSAPYAQTPVRLLTSGAPSSEPYIRMTMHVMKAFGADPLGISPTEYKVGNTARYAGVEFMIEGDASAAGYFFAAAAITGGRVRILNLPPESLQGDIGFSAVLEAMGCSVTQDAGNIVLTGGQLHGIDVDMNRLPDCVPTLAVVAAFADGPTTIRNIAHLRFKETDRISALSNELPKIGAGVMLTEDGMVITPAAVPHEACIETYRDHRMAMSFAVAGLRIPGIHITNPSCVSKSFPDFWDQFGRLERGEL